MNFKSLAFRRYVIIGLAVYLLELLVIVIAQSLNASTVTAIGISFWFGLIASFTLQKFVTFGDRRLHKRVIITQVFAFSLLVLFNFGFTIAMAKLLQNILPAVIVRTTAIGVTTIWNFYLYKTRIFKGSEELIY